MSSEPVRMDSEQRSLSIQAVQRSEKARARSLAASPTLADAKRELGSSAKYETHADGSWTATVRDERAIGRASAMLDGIREVQSDFGAEVQAGIARERVRRADGRVVEVARHTVEHIKHGVRPVIFWGKPKVRGRMLPDGGYEEARKNRDGSWNVTRWTKAQLDAAPRKPVK